MATALVGLGSNQGDRRAALAAAIAAIERLAKSSPLAISRFRETAPVGGPVGQPPFLNAAARLETPLGPLELLRELQTIESRLGRVRAERWGPRIVDLDLLLYDQAVLETPELTLPHPRMSFRRFVLEPAADVAADLLHPTTGWTVARLLEHLNTAKAYVAVLAASPALAHALAAAFSARVVSLDWVGYAHGNEDLQERMVRSFAASLDEAQWPSDGQLVVSNGRADEFLCRQFEGPNDGRTTAFIRAAATPKLTIVWEADPPAPRTLADSPESVTAGLAARRSQLRDVARLACAGPVCRLDAPSFDAALSEAIAAVRAME